MHREPVEQARSEMLKVIRAAVRLKHSINADRELNDVLPEAQKRFDAAVHRGQIPATVDIKRALKL